MNVPPTQEGVALTLTGGGYRQQGRRATAGVEPTTECGLAAPCRYYDLSTAPHACLLLALATRPSTRQPTTHANPQLTHVPLLLPLPPPAAHPLPAAGAGGQAHHQPLPGLQGEDGEVGEVEAAANTKRKYLACGRRWRSMTAMERSTRLEAYRLCTTGGVAAVAAEGRG